MIQPLRSGHRRVFLGLSAILPTLLVVGLMARHRNPRPVADRVDAPTRGTAATKALLQWQKHSIDSFFYLDPAHEGATEIVLNPQQPIDDPDLLLYWAAADAVAVNVSQAQLLGPFVPGKRYSLPSGERRGELVLYSLAHREVVDRAKIEDLP